MLVGLILSATCADDPLQSSTGSGFTRVAVSPNHTTTVALAGRTAVILDAAPDLFNYSITTADNQVWAHSSAYPYRHLLLSGELLSLGAISERSEIPIWIMPKDFCSNGTVALRALEVLLLRAKLDRHQNPICIFSQPEFRGARLIATVKSRDKAAHIALYGAQSVSEPLKTCRSGSRCELDADRPFLLRIESDPNKRLKLKMEYRVTGPIPGAIVCAALAVPWLRGGNEFGVVPQALEDLTVRCRPLTSNKVTVLVWSGALLLPLIAVGVLHRMHYVNIWKCFCRDRERQQFTNLKKKPFAAGIGDAHLEADA